MPKLNRREKMLCTLLVSLTMGLVIGQVSNHFGPAAGLFTMACWMGCGFWLLTKDRRAFRRGTIDLICTIYASVGQTPPYDRREMGLMTDGELMLELSRTATVRSRESSVLIKLDHQDDDPSFYRNGL